MTVEADLLGRPPIMRRVERRECWAAFERAPAAVPGRVWVRVPRNSSCSSVGEATDQVTMAALPWEVSA